MPLTYTATEKIMRLMDETMSLSCNCPSINDKLEINGESFGMVCCASCCDCHWEKILEEL